MSGILKKNFKFIFIFLSVLLVVPGVVGLLHSGFPLTDDGNWMVIRFSAFYEAFRNGQFPVRFLPRLNNGFGYPVSNFLYPLFMYIGIPIHLAGFSFVDTIKVIMGGSLIFSSLFTFLWLRKIFGSIASLVGAVSYSLFPYHLYDLYKRGSVGELLALSIVPFILWGIEKRNLAISSLGYGLLILSHNTLAILFIPTIFIYQLLRYKFSLKSLMPLLLGLSLSAFFSVPALYDRQYTIFSQVKISDYSMYFVNFDNLNLYGLIFFTSIAASFYLLIKNKGKTNIYFLILSLLALLITIPKAVPVWEFTFLQNYIQFPFRFVSIAVLSSSFLLASFLDLFKVRRLIFAFIILIIIYLSSLNFIYPKVFQYHPDTFYSTNQDTTTVKNEYMPKWVKKIPTRRYESKVEIINGEGEIKDFKDSGNRVSFIYVSKEPSLLALNTIYFPGWKLSIDKKNSQILYNNEGGLIQFKVDRGKHFIEAKFGETGVRLLSDLVSLGSLFVLLYLSLKRKYLI